MRSAEKVAEELSREFSDQWDVIVPDRIKNIVAQALTSFREEGVKEGKLEERYFWQHFIKEKAFKLSTVETIRASALEEAAKVCDRPVSEPLTSRRPGYFLAEQIRILKEKP